MNSCNHPNRETMCIIYCVADASKGNLDRIGFFRDTATGDTSDKMETHTELANVKNRLKKRPDPVLRIQLPESICIGRSRQSLLFGSI